MNQAIEKTLRLLWSKSRDVRIPWEARQELRIAADQLEKASRHRSQTRRMQRRRGPGEEGEKEPLRTLTAGRRDSLS